MRALTDAVGNGDQCCLLAARSRYKSSFPGKLQVKTVVRSGNKKNGTEIAGTNIFGGDHDGNAHSRGSDRDDDVIARLSEPSRAPGESTGTCIRNGVWWSLYKVCLELTETECLDDLAGVSIASSHENVDIPRGRNP